MREYSHEPCASGFESPHLLHGQNGAVCHSAVGNNAWVEAIRPLVDDQQRFLVQPLPVHSRHAAGVHAITANGSLHSSRGMPSRHGDIEVVIGNGSNRCRNGANLFHGRAAKRCRAHGDEATVSEQLSEDVAFGQRLKLMRVIVVPLFTAGIKLNGAPVDDAGVVVG